jgi:hypothetical protein
MRWRVIRAGNPDVEREHLNKILAEIEGEVTSVRSTLTTNAGPSGPAGPAGPQGQEGTTDRTTEVVADAAAVSALRVIVSDGDGNGRVADTTVAADAMKVIGISTTAASQFDSFEVQSTGTTELSTFIAEGPVFCDTAGTLSGSVPGGSGWLMQVGVSLGESPNSTILIDLKTPIIRT